MILCTRGERPMRSRRGKFKSTSPARRAQPPRAASPVRARRPGPARRPRARLPPSRTVLSGHFPLRNQHELVSRAARLSFPPMREAETGWVRPARARWGGEHSPALGSRGTGRRCRPPGPAPVPGGPRT